MSLHLSKYHFVGNHMSRLSFSVSHQNTLAVWYVTHMRKSTVGNFTVLYDMEANNRTFVFIL